VYNNGVVFAIPYNSTEIKKILNVLKRAFSANAQTRESNKNNHFKEIYLYSV